jgi:hypothetical protein
VDAVRERADLLEQRAAPAGALRRDVRSRQIEQVGHVCEHLAVKPAHRAVAPLRRVLVGPQVVLDQEADGVALVAREREPPVDPIEHPGADLGVAVKVDTFVGECPGRHLAHVVQQRGPADQGPAHGLPHDLLGVGPDVLVLPAFLLDEVDRGLELGEQQRQDPRLVQPLEREVDIAAHQRVLDGGAQPLPVGVGEANRVFRSERRDAVGGDSPTIIGNRTCYFEQYDRVRLDERPQAVGDLGIAGRGRESHRGAVFTMD